MLIDTSTKPTKVIASSKTSERLRAFDCLRGLAILGVIAVHTSQYFPSNIRAIDSVFGFGKFGIQLFFFISALTMCYMWKRREGERRPILNFYVRRFLRIAPLFWLAIPTYLLINGYGASYWAPEGIGSAQIFLTATFLHGFWPDSINSIVPGGWSIAVEMTFYALFPFLIIIIRANKKTYLYAAAAVWAFNVFFFRDFIVSFLSSRYLTTSTTIVNDFLYLNFINQAPIFLLGCYLFFSMRSRIQKGDILFLLFWLLLGATLRYLHVVDEFGFLVIYTILGMFVFACVRMNLRFKPLELLGRNSYAIYLVHFLVLHYLQKMLLIKTGLIALLLGFAFTALISYLLSMLIYELIEKNVQSLAHRITRPKAMVGT